MVFLRKLASTTLALCGLATSVPTSKEATVNFHVKIPTSPSGNRQVVDASFQSFSVEFFAFAEYSGNSTYSNPLNTNLVNNVRSWGGVPIKVRIGGASQTNLSWVPNQDQGMIGYYKDGLDKTYNVSVGPGFFDLFDAWPADTEFILGLTYPYDGESYQDTNIAIASGVHRKLKSRLIGIELGNERQDIGLDPPDYTSKFLGYAYPMSEAVFGDANKTILTAGTFIAPTLIECPDPGDEETCISTTSLFENGINQNDIIARADTHQYMLRFDSPTPTRQYLLNHNNTAYYVDSHKDLAAHSTALGVPYEFGETNSLFGHGRVGISDTFAAALWTIDYTLYSAQTNITRLAFHQCFGWRYSAWRPIPAFGYPAGVLPSYYGFWVVQKALGANNGSEKKIEIALAHDQLTVYGIYEASGGELSSIIALNLMDWSSSNDQDSRPTASLDLSTLKTVWRLAKVYRLSAEGADITDPEAIRFGGQYVNNEDGTIRDSILPDLHHHDTTVTLKASEAVLLDFSHEGNRGERFTI